MKMRVAAIDIGTNTVRLKVCDLAGGRLTPVAREVEITRLGFKVDETRRLDDAAMNRTVGVLSRYTVKTADLSVDKTIVVATSAVRDAVNRNEFTERAKAGTGADVEIITGEDEARMSFMGATRGSEFESSDRRVAVLDIGGGSTELILGRGSRYEMGKSVDIGSVRLTEMFVRSDPPSETEMEDIRVYTQKSLAPTVEAIRKQAQDITLVGVAGTVTTIVAVRDAMTVYDPDKVHMSKLRREDIEDVLSKFTSARLEERRAIPGLEPKRADVIIAGTLIAVSVLDALALDEMIVSESDILDGAMWKLIERGQNVFNS